VNDTVTLVTGVAVGLALIDAMLFAASATLQHHAVSDKQSDGHLTMRGLLSVVKQRRWQAGIALGGLAVLLHAIALLLAPLRVVQPVGVLAVPIAVLLTAARVRLRPPRGVVIGAALAVTGVVSFVIVSAGSVTSHPPKGSAVVAACLVVAALVVLLTFAGLAARGWLRCVAYATAAATAFGLVSALVRAVSLSVTSGEAELLDTGTLLAGAVILCVTVGGGWLVQQAYAAGAPAVVVASLTVVDPIVAVLLGAVLLGEGAHTPLGLWLVMGVATAAAVAGVITLAKHHPDATTRATPVEALLLETSRP
jgi:drug/metabolite transporter (DMT)-like permease